MRCLLQLIAGTHEEYGKIRGEFVVNGHKQKRTCLKQRIGKLDLVLFHNFSAHVKQETILPSSLTVLQYLGVHMRYRPPPRGRYPKVGAVLSSLALFPLKDRLCSKLGRAEKERVKLAAEILRDTG